MKAAGRPKIDGVRVGEVEADFLIPLPTISVKFAYENSETGRTCGFGYHSTWSEETMQKMRELISSMETDIINAMFEGGAVGTHSPVQEPPAEGITSL